MSAIETIGSIDVFVKKLVDGGAITFRYAFGVFTIVVDTLEDFKLYATAIGATTVMIEPGSIQYMHYTATSNNREVKYLACCERPMAKEVSLGDL